MKAVVLAAGTGSRLKAFNPDGRPKCLFEFNGQSILSRQLSSLLDCGINEVELVLGYQGDQVIEHVSLLTHRPALTFAYCPGYEKGSAYSLLAAKASLESGDSCLLMDSDLLFDEAVLRRCLADDQSSAAAIDRSVAYRPGLVSVGLLDDRVTGFSDAGAFEEDDVTTAVAVGITKLDPQFSERALVIGSAMVQSIEVNTDYPQVLNELTTGQSGHMGHIDITGLNWQKLITPEDIGHALDITHPGHGNQ